MDDVQYSDMELSQTIRAEMLVDNRLELTRSKPQFVEDISLEAGENVDEDFVGQDGTATLRIRQNCVTCRDVY